jgi:hypothetical protein
MSAKARKTRKGEGSKSHRKAHRGQNAEARRRERAQRFQRMNDEDQK